MGFGFLQQLFFHGFVFGGGFCCCPPSSVVCCRSRRREDGGELRLRPFNDADGGAVHQEAGNRRAPDDLVDDAVGAVRAVAEAVAV